MTENPSVADEHPLLRVSGATVVFGGVVAVGDVSLTVERGEILGLVGPNGAGKSTLFGAIAGAVPLKSGTVELRGERVSGRRPHQMSRLGVARTFQKVRLFNTLTATENVLVAARSHERSLSRARQITEESLEIAGFRADRGVPTTSLPLADRKRVEIARAIAAKPQLLLLDEMMNGLTIEETDALVAAIKALPAEGITVILVEHVLRVVRSLCDRLVVLHHGRKIAEGLPDDVLSESVVAEAWLGQSSTEKKER